MTENPSAPQEARRFRAVLHPHRSLSPRGFLALMLFFGAVSFVAGIAFAAMGAWPVMGFFGVDVAILYFALKINYRDARAHELVELDTRELTVTRVGAKGERERTSFNPYWVRVKLAETADGRTELSLASHGRSFTFGHVLSDDERREFAGVLSGALAAVGAQGTAPA